MGLYKTDTCSKIDECPGYVQYSTRSRRLAGGGTTTTSFMPSAMTKMFISRISLSEASRLLRQEFPCQLYPFDMCGQLRQLRSQFDRDTTYLLLRASSSLINQNNLRSYSIWTLTDFDDETLKDAQTKITSLFFKSIARSVLRQDGYIAKEQVQRLYDRSSGKIKQQQSRSWNCSIKTIWK